MIHISKLCLVRHYNSNLMLNIVNLAKIACDLLLFNVI